MTNDPFPPTSRYRGVGVDTFTAPGGLTIAYVRRRFVPPPEAFQVLLEHTVIQGQRLDNIAAQYLGDPTFFWRLCDANGAMDPGELTAVPGKRLRVTLPEGIPGTSAR